MAIRRSCWSWTCFITLFKERGTRISLEVREKEMDNFIVSHNGTRTVHPIWFVKLPRILVCPIGFLHGSCRAMIEAWQGLRLFRMCPLREDRIISWFQELDIPTYLSSTSKRAQDSINLIAKHRIIHRRYDQGNSEPPTECLMTSSKFSKPRIAVPHGLSAADNDINIVEWKSGHSHIK